MTSIRSNFSGLPPIQGTQEQPTAVESSQRTETGSGPVTEAKPSNTPGTLIPIGPPGVMQKTAEAFVGGTLLYAELHTKLNRASANEPDDFTASQLQQTSSDPPNAESIFNTILGAGQSPEEGANQRAGFNVGLDPFFQGGVRPESNNENGINAEGNLTISGNGTAQLMTGTFIPEE